MIEALRLVQQRKLTRLLISMPPRHFKSETVTVRYPAYELEDDPHQPCITMAYNQTLANRFSRKTRKVLLDNGRVPLSRTRYGAEEWETAAGGGLRAAGMLAGVTGMGARLLMIDDPIKGRKDANSLAFREGIWGTFTDDVLTRLEPGAALVGIMTRWHWDDLFGRIMRSEEADHYVVMNLPALAEAQDPLGRTLGAALCPQRYDEGQLDRLRRVMGLSFYALFQGRPSPDEGSIFERQWFNRYPEVINLDRICRVQSWDCANKGNDTANFSVCTTWDVTKRGVYLRHVWRERVHYPDLRRNALGLRDRWRPDVVLVEDKGNGQALIPEMHSYGVPVLAIEPVGDKVIRATTESVIFQAGLVYLPERAPWLPDYEAELLQFPMGEDDDQVDSTSQFCRWLRSTYYHIEVDHMGIPSVSAQAIESGAASDAMAIDLNTGFGRVRGHHDTEGY